MSKERLVELLLQCDKEHETLICFKDRPRKKQTAEIIADYILANGVVVPPCKVGDTVYEFFDVRGFYDINELIVTNITIGINPKMCALHTKTKLSGSATIYYDDCFGKTIFFTREEAEKALNNVGNGNS